MNKASGSDGIPVELFQILKDDAVKVLHLICQQVWNVHLDNSFKIRLTQTNQIFSLTSIVLGYSILLRNKPHFNLICHEHLCKI